MEQLCILTVVSDHNPTQVIQLYKAKHTLYTHTHTHTNEYK